MFDYTSNGVSLTLIRDTRYKDTLEACPIKWRVTYQRKSTYYLSGINLLQNEWEILSDSRKPAIKEYRETLQNHYDEVLKKIIKDLAEKGIFSFDLFNVRLGKSTGNDLKQAFNAKIKKLVDNDKIGNASIYRCTLRSIENYNSKTILFSDITPKWLEKYQTFLIEKPIRYATIGIYMRTLRAVINDAKDANIINPSAYPFGLKKNGKFEIPTGGGRELSLELEDINKINEYTCPTKTIERCRDLWLFSFYCNGANFGDMLRFRFSDINDGEIYFYRKKTKDTSKNKIEIIAPILEPMQKIIEKWGNDEAPKNFIFPFLNESKTETEYKAQIHNVIRLTNKTIKLVTKALKLPDISTYNARHSYATILNKNRVPESFISEQLGHSNNNVTQSYFGRYSKKERLKYNNFLIWKPKKQTTKKKI